MIGLALATTLRNSAKNSQSNMENMLYAPATSVVCLNILLNVKGNFQAVFFLYIHII